MEKVTTVSQAVRSISDNIKMEHEMETVNIASRTVDVSMGFFSTAYLQARAFIKTRTGLKLPSITRMEKEMVRESSNFLTANNSMGILTRA